MQSPGNIHTLPHRRDWNFLRLGGSVRLKNLKKCVKLNWNFQRGGSAVLEKIPSVEEVCIFSGIFAHLNFVCRIKLSLCHLVFKVFTQRSWYNRNAKPRTLFRGECLVTCLRPMKGQVLHSTDLSPICLYNLLSWHFLNSILETTCCLHPWLVVC